MNVYFKHNTYRTANQLSREHPPIQDFPERWQRHGPFNLCTGCFDVLHRGHLELIKATYDIGEKDNGCSCIVGINSDASIRRLKGPGRPIFNQKDRAWVLSKFLYVDGVVVFSEDTVVKTLKALRPVAWVKGGDYTIETLNQEERRAAEEIGTRIVILPRIGEYSTSGIIERLKA